jgi:hypothetical protein
VSFVKSTHAKQQAAAKRGRPKASESMPAPATTSGSFAVEDIVAFKDLVDRFGKENLTRPVKVL